MCIPVLMLEFVDAFLSDELLDAFMQGLLALGSIGVMVTLVFEF